jgi:hypothetical protein
MKKFSVCATMMLGLAGAVFASAAVADGIIVTKAPPPAQSAPSAPVACTDVVEFFTTSCPLSW